MPGGRRIGKASSVIDAGHLARRFQRGVEGRPVAVPGGAKDDSTAIASLWPIFSGCPLASPGRYSRLVTGRVLPGWEGTGGVPRCVSPWL